MIAQFLFLMALGITSFFAIRNAKKITRAIALGSGSLPKDQKNIRRKLMFKVAFGQSKMTARIIPAILHLIVYLGFVIINIEVLEIVIDGLFGTHRAFSFLGITYQILIASFEVLALLVLLSCVLFLLRRNVLRLARFQKPEMKGWAKSDANLILTIEIVLMSAFLIMNATDYLLQERGIYVAAGSFPISQFLTPAFQELSTTTLIVVERACWWLHILGIFAFLNYLVISKHLHIILAFPNVYFSKLLPKTALNNMAQVKREVELMMGITPAEPEAELPSNFGAKDVTELTPLQLLNAFTCTECGRCTSVCPANITGKKLSPRKIMMDTRARATELEKEKSGKLKTSEKQLLGDYILEEELWACTTCNACTEACPINIDPVSIIMEMRRYLIMEQSSSAQPIQMMMTNVENNGAPWQYSQMDRLNWATES